MGTEPLGVTIAVIDVAAGGVVQDAQAVVVRPALGELAGLVAVVAPAIADQADAPGGVVAEAEADPLAERSQSTEAPKL